MISRFHFRRFCTATPALKVDSAGTSQLVPLLELFVMKRKAENERVGQHLRSMGLTHLFEHKEYGTPIFNRQIELEVNAVERAVDKYNRDLTGILERRVGAGTQPATELMRDWYEPLKQAIEMEQAAILSGNLFEKEMDGKEIDSAENEQVQIRRTQQMDRSNYGPYLVLLAAEKLAVITLNEVMGSLMANPEGETVTKLAIQIATAVEVECALHARTRESPDTNVQSLLSTDINRYELQNRKLKMQKLKKSRDIKKLLWFVKQQNVWGVETRAKVGSALIALLLENCRCGAHPAFIHSYQWRANSRKYGVIRPHSLVLRMLEEGQTFNSFLFPQYMPMLVKPIPWSSPSHGAFLTLPCKMMKTKSSERQTQVLRENKDQLHEVYKALNVLGSTPWKINHRVLAAVEQVWEEGGDLCDVPNRQSLPIPDPIERDEEITDQEWLMKSLKFQKDTNEIKKINRELVSLRADFLFKLEVARQFKHDIFYFPHNLDFRGRAYPVPPHLNHLGSDVCRGLLLFGEGLPLGRRGLQWLKLHLSSLCGHNKIPFSQREQWVEQNMDNIYSVAKDPLGKAKHFWMKADEPWQTLATCFELYDALTSPSPMDFVSHLPIHQDGSCNGLQHYAALGRDTEGARAVNMIESEKPSDPYNGVAVLLAKIVEEEAKEGNKYAAILNGKISRKIVKQTVMTSVYGVTFIGARNQIQARLKELETIPDDMLYPCACYLAQKTLRALNESFVGLKNTKNWLAELAKQTAKYGAAVEWKTPIGLPVVQPYRSMAYYRIDTVVQNLSIAESNDSRPPLVRKQSSAFPPNFIHSLDSSHMMMTAVACHNQNLTFAGVHDSFWTHACNVDSMGQLLREQFIRLHSKPILENLLADIKKTVGPDAEFDDLPPRGDFDVRQVANSPFFFS